MVYLQIMTSTILVKSSRVFVPRGKTKLAIMQLKICFRSVAGSMPPDRLRDNHGERTENVYLHQNHIQNEMIDWACNRCFHRNKQKQPSHIPRMPVWLRWVSNMEAMICIMN